MKSLIFPSVLLTVWLPFAMQAQSPAEAPATPSAPKLTDAQVANVLGQLKELENQIQQMRGSNLSSILTKLRSGLASDQAAMGLYLECFNLVNSERKDVDKSDARKRQEAMEKNMERRAKGGNGGAAEEGDAGFAVRLGLQYLILTLEAHEASPEDFKKMVPKLQEYVQAVVAAAPQLKGRAQNYLSSALNGPVVEAFNLQRYLTVKNWSTRPADIGNIYTLTLLPLAEENDKESLPALWDARINAEGTFRKELLFPAEFEIWTQNELPALRWQRATYLYAKGPSAINAMADMLKLIKENPGHADAPKWVKELRQMVNASAPSGTSPNAQPPADSLTGS